LTAISSVASYILPLLAAGYAAGCLHLGRQRWLAGLALLIAVADGVFLLTR